MDALRNLSWDAEIYGHLLSVATYAMTLVFTAILLRSRRPPANTVAWLILIAFVPYFGVPLFLMIGGRKMRTRRERRKSPIYAKVPYDRTLSSLKRTERILLAAGAPAPLQNQRIELIDSGETAFTVLIERIRSAKRSIDLAMFIMKRDESGLSLLKELTLKASQGVRVRLLLDAAGSHVLVRPSLTAFRKAGGQALFFMPLLHWPSKKGRVNLRNHRKLAIFDGQATWFGGMNLASEYLGPKPRPGRWADLSVMLEGGSSKHFQEIFESDWYFAGGVPVASKSLFQEESAVVAGGSQDSREPDGGKAQVVASGPDVPEDPLYETLLESCFEAKHRIWIATPYFVPDESLIKALELACRRGVEVRLLVPERSDHGFADLSRGSYIRQLMTVGGRVFLFPKMMHAKLMVVDDSFALAGSANFDLRSLLYNYEIGVFLYSHKEIASAVRWMEESFVVSKEGYPKAGFWKDLAEGVGRVFGPLI